MNDNHLPSEAEVVSACLRLRDMAAGELVNAPALAALAGLGSAFGHTVWAMAQAAILQMAKTGDRQAIVIFANSLRLMLENELANEANVMAGLFGDRNEDPRGGTGGR